jgi:hypothetical protein
MATTAAIGAAPRGFCFQSHTSLAGTAPENRIRALALELTNLRLGLVEPWIAASKPPVAARSTWPDVTGMVCKVERSHLIIPLQWDAHAAAPPRTMLPNTSVDRREALAFDLPGVPETSDAYLISISGSERLPSRRVTGGLRITAERLPDDAFLLVTEDGYAYSHVERYLRAHAPRAAQARVEMAALRRQQAAKSIAALPPAMLQASGAQKTLASADAQLTSVIETMRSRDYPAAFAAAAETERLLDQALGQAASTFSFVAAGAASPIPLDWTTIAEVLRTTQLAVTATSKPQLLRGGDFEDVNELLSGGWQRVQEPSAGVEATVRLSPEAPARGRYCLELEACSDAAGGSPPVLAAPPVWVTSPALLIPAGQLVEISGLARVSNVPIGSPDPLLIFDSIGGEESAVRISSAPSWTPFKMLRAATPGSELRVTVALGGVGRAQIDALSYRFIPQSTSGNQNNREPIASRRP